MIIRACQMIAYRSLCLAATFAMLIITNANAQRPPVEVDNPPGDTLAVDGQVGIDPTDNQVKIDPTANEVKIVDPVDIIPGPMPSDAVFLRSARGAIAAEDTACGGVSEPMIRSGIGLPSEAFVVPDGATLMITDFTWTSALPGSSNAATTGVISMTLGSITYFSEFKPLSDGDIFIGYADSLSTPTPVVAGAEVCHSTAGVRRSDGLFFTAVPNTTQGAASVIGYLVFD